MILHLLYIFNLILLSYFIKLLFKACFFKSTDINQYKILDRNLSTIIIISYLSLIVIGLYIYRLFRIGNTLDLKLLYNQCTSYIIIEIPIIHKFYLILHGVFLLILFMLLLMSIHKYASRELFKVYIFVNYNSFLSENRSTKYFINIFYNIGAYNVISFILNKSSYNFMLFLKDLDISHGAVYKEFEMPDFKFRSFLWDIIDHRFLGIKHIYTFDIFLYYFIPILIILYDCFVYNNVLIHIFYYIPFIIPIILLQKVTKTVGRTDITIQNLIWEMYYKKENCIYACTNEKKNILDAYLINGLQYLPGLALVFLHDELTFLNNSPLHFKPIMEERNINMYQNDFGDCAQKLPNGDFIIVTDYLFEDDIKKYGSNEIPFIQYGEKLILLVEK